MAKENTKKKTDTDEIAEFLSANPPPDEVPQENEREEKSPKTKSPPAADDKPYTTLAYAGRPLYRCKQCPYDAFEVETVLEHIRARHTPEAPEPTVLVADKRGKQVKQ